MAKANKKCADCVLCETNANGISRCKFYDAGAENIIFPENSACKMITGPVNLRKNKKTEPEYGDAPFCNNFPKCNNAEGCDTCKEFEEWLEKTVQK